MSTNQGFKTTGFYLHTHWAYNYPFAVRSWTRSDFAGMFELLRALDFDRVMIWPISEALPPPLSAEDARYLDDRRAILGDAHAAGLESWFAFAPAISTRARHPRAAGQPAPLQPHARTFRLRRPGRARDYTPTWRKSSPG